MNTTEKALAHLDAGIRQMEEAGGHPLKTRATLEALSAVYFWRAVESLCQRDTATSDGAINNPVAGRYSFTPGESEAG